MNILITGTNGFVGRNLKEYFQHRYENLDCPKRDKLNLLDSDAVSMFLNQKKFDVVIHCGVTLHSVEENLKMYFNLERCSSFFGRLFCIGSGAEFGGEHYTPKMEEEYFGTHIPSDIYGFSKYVIAKDIEVRKRNIYNLRVFGIFGKYENYKRRFISNNICRALSGLPISINKNMFFDYIDVKDFAEIVETFIKRDIKDRTYNICRGENIDLLSLANIIRDVDGRELSVNVVQDGYKPEYTGSNTRFLQEFGDFEFASFEDSITELYRWYQYESNIDFDALAFA